LQRIEIVESTPFYIKQAFIQEDDQGERMVLKSNALSEFRLLAEGSEPPSFQSAPPNRER
jgi:hypothetical protein